MTKPTFHGKEYDTISFAPSYIVAALITNAMDTDDAYRVDPGTEVAVLTKSMSNEVVGLFHVLNVDAVLAHFEKRDVEISIKGGSEANQVMISLVSGNRKIVFEAIAYHTYPVTRLIANVEELTIQHFTKYDEEYGWEETSNKIHLGFKRSDPTGYFISELDHTLTYSE